VKDSFVRTAQSTNNSIFIEQVMRIKSNSLEEKKASFEPLAKPKLELVNTEISSTTVFEIKPYIANPNFQPKVRDKEDRIGYFINFVVKNQIDEPIPQITRWDVNPEREPITVRIHEGAPQAALKAMNEGILYWNRVMGRDVLVIGKPFASDEKQVDRTIHVFWIPWDTAGFARAGFQADPLTGEIFRAQVFMTSSWYKSTREAFNLLISDQSTSTASKYVQCGMDQSKMLNIDFVNLPDDAAIERASLDTVRLVLAHEMGHALGLRHNFVGSSTTTTADTEFKKNNENYLRGDLTGLVASSTTVMDYTLGIETAINGSVLANSVLPYDKAAIDWAYNDTDISIPKYQYCSDEHIMLANASEKNIYGCDRFDKYKNIILGHFDTIELKEKNKVRSLFKNLLDMASAPESFYQETLKVDSLISSITFTISSDVYSLEQFMFKEPSAGFYNIRTVIDGLLPSLSGSFLTSEDKTVNEKVKSDSTAAGGLVGLIDRLVNLQKSAGGKLYQNQAAAFFDQLDPALYEKHLSAEQFNKIKTRFSLESKRLDETFLREVLTSLPVIKTGSKISTHFFLGDSAQLSEYSIQAYESVIHQVVVKGAVNRVEKYYKFLDQSIYQLENLRIFFAPTAAEICSESICQLKLTEARQKAKTLAVMNTVEILQALGLAPAVVTSAQLQKQLYLVDWTKITGITQNQLQAEINELAQLENLK
jgi:hypothetical protein